MAGAAAIAEAPARVVSLNLCTDQMALLLGAPGQVVGVTELAHDPRSSAMTEAAAGVPSHNASAEAVVLMRPDLVLAGTWTTRATVEMLERLGIPVVEFAPANSLDEARAALLRMGALLGREAQAARIVADFDARLAALADKTGPRPRAALYFPLNGTAGRQTLAGDILAAAGIDNIAEARGLPYGGRLAMEELILDDPDLILVGQPYNGHARATEALQHPALRATGALRRIENGAAWVCETPALLDAVAEMVALRRDWERGR
ncbi:ABC transporter substrate-binding protein [Thalassococcus sp. CAU 1522]|uniref:ABC transporter substrate-binding protein n=1 Tax=Thalassococcus arenae TaxID=2851652 RepID=A0ABS6N927_9RHOB|nr:ABC transporter substrate-binding protein [Thalassococcus arenae]MBV2360506.1 ABC transporter substrate-binding protein [Thalassococcus arenae]